MKSKPSSYLTACALSVLRGKSRPICFTSVFLQSNALQHPSTFITWTKFITKKRLRKSLFITKKTFGAEHHGKTDNACISRKLNIYKNETSLMHSHEIIILQHLLTPKWMHFFFPFTKIKALRVSILCDGREGVLLTEFMTLLLGVSRETAGLHDLRQTVRGDGRGPVSGIHALLHGILVPGAAEVPARLPVVLRLQRGAVRVDARVDARVLQRVVFATVAARHGESCCCWPRRGSPTSRLTS